MKKLIALLSVFVMVGCTNPSMEDGLAGLNDALDQLEKAIADLNIAQMEADLAQMNSDVAQMIVDLEAQQGVWDDAIAQVAAISEMLDGILADSENWATSADMQALLADLEVFSEGVDLLVLQADYDYDGVINAIDKCPNTPLTEINNVDAQGCAPSETPNN